MKDFKGNTSNKNLFYDLANWAVNNGVDFAITHFRESGNIDFRIDYVDLAYELDDAVHFEFDKEYRFTGFYNYAFRCEGDDYNFRFTEENGKLIFVNLG